MVEQSELREVEIEGERQGVAGRRCAGVGWLELTSLPVSPLGALKEREEGGKRSESDNSQSATFVYRWPYCSAGLVGDIRLVAVARTAFVFDVGSDS